MSAALLRIAGWSYLPDIATRQALSIIHQLSLKFFQTQPPPPHSPTYIQHYRYAYTAVVLCYLTYNFIDASRGLPRNFYELLGVEPHMDEGALKAAFRAFARKNHPDRVGPAGEAHFIAVRDAFEALKDPVVRFAYDRFGPDVLRWKECSTMKEYLRRGLVNSSMYHLMTGAGLVLFSVVGKPNPIAVWRYLLFISMFALEVYLILSPSPSFISASGPSAYSFVDQATPSTTLLDTLFPWRVGYQHILFLHQIFFFVSVALSRVAPVLFAGFMRVDGEVEEEAVRAMGERIGELIKGIERELSIMVNTELHSIHQSSPPTSTSTLAPMSLTPTDLLKPPEHLDEFTMQALMGEMEDIVIENKLKSEVGPMRSAWDKAVATSLGGEGKGSALSDALGAPTLERRHGRARSMSV
ncbi:DnaJ-domain-containing protein [Gyrodon lividus]|nr:DnaJ-domain-containing protein [Gyrodon lividus]